MSGQIRVAVQQEDFDAGAQLAAMRQHSAQTGAITCFVGLVRDINDNDDITALELEHYPGMTQRSIADIAEQALARWELLAVRVIHRTGKLLPTDQIVLVAVSSKHRAQAFAACEFIMDYLKTRAPFWKKEHTLSGERWVQARVSDQVAAKRWSG